MRWRDAARWTVLFQLFYKHSWDRIGSFSRVTSIQHTYLSRRQRPVDIRRQSLGICRSLDRRSMCVLHVENASTPPSSIATHLRLISRRSVYVLHVENASTHPSSIATHLRLTSRRSVYVLHVENASTHPSSIANHLPTHQSTGVYVLHV